MTVGTINFRNAYTSGVIIEHLGSGTYDHIGFFGANGTTSAVTINQYQDTTIIVDDAGNPANDLSLAGAVGSSGQMINTKYIDSTTVDVSGAQKSIVDINVFDVANLTTYPEFIAQNSGCLMIEYRASGVSEVNIFNPKIWAYDAGGALTDTPPDVAVFAYEVNASGKFVNNAAVSGVWKNIGGQAAAMPFLDHSSANGYEPRNQHLFVCGISVRPTSVGALDQWNLGFSLQFA